MSRENQMDRQSKFSEEEIMRLTEILPLPPVYVEGSDSIDPMMLEAVNKIMHYDDFGSVSTMLLLNDPKEIKENMHKADLITLMIFLKFLNAKYEETGDMQLSAIRSYLLALIRQVLESREGAKEV